MSRDQARAEHLWEPDWRLEGDVDVKLDPTQNSCGLAVRCEPEAELCCESEAETAPGFELILGLRTGLSFWNP